MDFIKRNSKRIVLEGLGWILVVVGLAALVLPGPGLLALFAGMALLATQYEWAERRLGPIKRAALKTASDSVKSWPHILLSGFFSLGLLALGIIWVIQPAQPPWWPLQNGPWLAGGWGTGISLIISSLAAISMIIYSYIFFRPKSKHKQ